MRSNFLTQYKFPTKGRNFLSQEEIPCHRKKFSVTGRNFQSQQQKIPVTGRNFLSLDEILWHRKRISCHRKKYSVTGKHLLLLEVISSHGNKFPVTGKNFLSREEIFHKECFSCETKLIFFPLKQYVIPVGGFAPPLAIHLLCTNSIIHVTTTSLIVTGISLLMKFGSS